MEQCLKTLVLNLYIYAVVEALARNMSFPLYFEVKSLKKYLFWFYPSVYFALLSNFGQFVSKYHDITWNVSFRDKNMFF